MKKNEEIKVCFLTSAAIGEELDRQGLESPEIIKLSQTKPSEILKTKGYELSRRSRFSKARVPRIETYALGMLLLMPKHSGDCRH